MSKMKATQSSDGICQASTSDIKAADEKIFSSSLLPPLCLTGAYIFLIYKLSMGLKEEAETEPIQRVWWSGPICFTFAYLLMITVGQKYMESRKEFKIKPYIFTYNMYQCLFNTWILGGMIYEIYSNPHFVSIWGNTAARGVTGFNISYYVWAHYNNKYLELLDTVWMVLRKKKDQVSFLHCYHHILLIWAWFLVCNIETSGDEWFGAACNSFIHIIMYGYYTLALLNIPCPWKKWITNCQMVQFVVVLSHSCYVVYKGNAPLTLSLAQAFVMLNMLVLFGQFYVQKYLKKPTKKVE